MARKQKLNELGTKIKEEFAVLENIEGLVEENREDDIEKARIILQDIFKYSEEISQPRSIINGLRRISLEQNVNDRVFGSVVMLCRHFINSIINNDNILGAFERILMFTIRVATINNWFATYT